MRSRFLVQASIMRSDFKDSISNIVSSTASLLLADAPKRTVYGAIFGEMLHVLLQCFAHLHTMSWIPSAYQCVVFGVGIVNLRAMLAILVGRPVLSEKYEEQLEVLRRLKREGLITTP